MMCSMNLGWQFCELHGYFDEIFGNTIVLYVMVGVREMYLLLL